MMKEDLAGVALDTTIAALREAAIYYFDKPMTEHNLDAILSINNSSSSYSAASAYPCLAIPMGYSEAGEPSSLTFIARPFQEDKLLKMGYAFEKATKMRQAPEGFN
jgi:amidase